MHASFAFTLLSLAGAATAAFTGVNIGGNNNDGSCRTTADWQNDLTTVKSWGFNAVRVFASSDCSTVLNIAPAALAVNVSVLVGVWAVPDAHYVQEKSALYTAVQQYGSKWIAGVSVGSEDLYRNDVSGQYIADRVNDVRNMLVSQKVSVPVGHTDTWTAWVNGANAATVAAVDMVITDAYPYWQGAADDQAKTVFETAVNNTIAAVGGKPVWIGETGFPTGGDHFGNAYPSVAGLQSYWTAVGCALNATGAAVLNGRNFFWYAAFDAPTAAAGVEQNFGLSYANHTLKIKLAC